LIISLKHLLEILKTEVEPAVGGTEPIAVAREQVGGDLRSLNIVVDSNIYKKLRGCD